MRAKGMYYVLGMCIFIIDEVTAMGKSGAAGSVSIQVLSPKRIDIKPKNVSPRSLQEAVSTRSDSDDSSAVKYKIESVSDNDKSLKQNCELRISCCDRVMKCGSTTVTAAAVVAMGLVAFYLYKLDSTCSQLISPVESIDDKIGQGLGLANTMVNLANQSLAFMRGALPDVESLYNSTAAICYKSQEVCQAAIDSWGGHG